MITLIHKIRKKIQKIENSIEDDLAQTHAQFKYRFEKSRIIFEQEALSLQRQSKRGLIRFFRETPLLFILTSPVIYSLIFPIMLCDIFVSVFQAICFPIYGIPKVRRKDYVVMDRKYLAYLNPIEKINCMYCEYANGVIAYMREIASRTEHYWCPIKHAKTLKDPPAYYDEYLEYGDSNAFHNNWEKQRETCKACEVKNSCSEKG